MIPKIIKRKWGDGLVNIISGKNQKQVLTANGPYPIYGSGGIIGQSKESLSPAGCTIVGRKGTINRPIFVERPFWNVDTAFALAPSQDLLPKYLFYFCLGFNFSRLDNSTTIPSLAKSVLLEIKMPVPEREEQQRIVERIEELFSEIDKAEEELKSTLEKINLFRKSCLENAFSDLTNCQETTLSSLLTSAPKNGYSPKAVNYETPYKNLTLSATTSGIFKEGFYKYIDITQSKASNLWVKHHDILIQRANTIDYVGMAVLYEGLDNIYVYPDLIMKCHVKKNINSHFIVYQLQREQTRKYYRENATGTSGNMPKINQKTVKNTPVLIADLSTQNEVVEIINRQISSCRAIEQEVNVKVQQIAILRQSILKKAFAGKLV